MLPQAIRYAMRMLAKQPAFTAVTVLAVALGSGANIRSLLFEVSPVDQAIYITVTSIIALVAIIACWLPAHPASRVDPIQALRYE